MTVVPGRIPPDHEYLGILDNFLPKLSWYSPEQGAIVRKTLLCQDKRQNGTCGCIQRYVMSEASEGKLNHIATLSFDSHRLKTERNPIAGRRYSDSFAKHVNEHRSELSRYKLCKKAIASVLHCSLNFLYRDNNNKQKVVKKIEQIRATPCCEKQCLAKLCAKVPHLVGQWRHRLEQKDSKSEENRKIYYELRQHELAPCSKAIGEITGLSKATLNNLSSKPPDVGIRHALQGRRRQPSGPVRPERARSSNSSTASSISPAEQKLFAIEYPQRNTVIKQRSPDVIVKLENTSLPVIQNGEISKHVGPMRSRLLAESSEGRLSVHEHSEIPTLLQDSVIIEEKQASMPIFMPRNASATPPADPEIPEIVERRKRKKMPGLIRLNSPGLESQSSPALHLKNINLQPDVSPGKKAKPTSCHKPTIHLNTPTITPNTPSNPSKKSTPVQNGMTSHTFFSY